MLAKQNFSIKSSLEQLKDSIAEESISENEENEFMDRIIAESLPMPKMLDSTRKSMSLKQLFKDKPLNEDGLLTPSNEDIGVVLNNSESNT